MSQDSDVHSRESAELLHWHSGRLALRLEVE